jgi:hypothetical protein
MNTSRGGTEQADSKRGGLDLRVAVVLVILALTPAAYFFLSARSERADLMADVAAAEGVTRALADSLDAARTQLLVDRLLVVTREGDMEQATELASRFFDRVDRRSRVRSAPTDETDTRLSVLAMRDRTIEALTRADPGALRLIEEIAALHLSLGDPTLGARIPGVQRLDDPTSGTDTSENAIAPERVGISLEHAARATPVR